MLKRNDFDFFKELTRDSVEACRVAPGRTAADKLNKLGFNAYRPGGRDCYPAIWIQDFTMIYASGFVSRKDGLSHLQLILECQNTDEPIALENSASIPPHAIADHINFDGSPVFFPGTYSSGTNQGGEPWGTLPPVNNHYDVIWLTEMLLEPDNPRELLELKIKVKSVYDRLRNAFDVPLSNPDNGLVFTKPELRSVGFIFCDSIYMTGYLLTASLLRYRAASHMASFAEKLEKRDDVKKYKEICSLIKMNLEKVFEHPSGWLKAATGISSQPDVWGTAFAVYSGLLSKERSDLAVETIFKSFEDGNIEFEGAFRHVPLNYDFSEESPWERTCTDKNTYQNGAYWHMPTGWIIASLQERYPDSAQNIYDRFIEHMKLNSFSKGDNFSAPWECIGLNGTANQNPIFAPSVTMPYFVISKLLLK
jgi:hypothetical protein